MVYIIYIYIINALGFSWALLIFCRVFLKGFGGIRSKSWWWCDGFVFTIGTYHGMDIMDIIPICEPWCWYMQTYIFLGDFGRSGKCWDENIPAPWSIWDEHGNLTTKHADWNRKIAHTVRCRVWGEMLRSLMFRPRGRIKNLGWIFQLCVIYIYTYYIESISIWFYMVNYKYIYNYIYIQCGTPQL